MESLAISKQRPRHPSSIVLKIDLLQHAVIILEGLPNQRLPIRDSARGG